MGAQLLDQLKETVEFIRSKSELKPKVGITLGSGLGSFGNKVDIDVAIPYSEIPHFIPPTVEGHSGQMILGHVGQQPVVVLQGRVHYYEGHSMHEVVYPTRVIAQLGIERLILTNAAGGIDPTMQPGDFMILKDHINLTGNNPLIGPNIKELGLRFPDMSEPYDLEMIQTLTDIMEQKKIRHSVGVYCGVSGPTYETASEIKYLQTIGGNAVGMSTVPENIAAKHMGLAVCGISCVTNLATGISTSKITHEEVAEVGRQVETQFSDFLQDFIQKI